MFECAAVLFVLALSAALVAESPPFAGAALVLALVAAGLLCASALCYAVASHRRKAFERGLHLWSSTPSQQYRL